MTDEAKAARRAYRKKWRAEHKEEQNAYHRKWNKEHPDRVKQYQEDYWNRKAQAAQEV